MLRPDEIAVCGFSLFPAGQAPPYAPPRETAMPVPAGKRWLNWFRGRDRVL